MHASGIQSRIWAAAIGASMLVTQSAQAAVAPNGGMQIFCPPDIEVSCADRVLPDFTGFPTGETDCLALAIDIGGENGVLYFEYEDTLEEGDCAGSFTIFRRWVAFDDCESMAVCTQRIDVVNTSLPEIGCELPSVMDVPPMQVLDAQTCVAEVPDLRANADAADDCDPSPTVTQTPAPGSLFTNSVTVILRAEDDCGNVSETSCEVVVQCQVEEVCVLAGTVCAVPAEGEIFPEEVAIRCTGLEGVAVRLLRLPDLNLVQTVVTDSGGNYQFDVQAPGSYLVQVDEATLPPGVVPVPFGHNPESPVDYDPLATFCPPLEFFYEQQLLICGIVWFDQNGNGIADEDLVVNGLNDVPVRLSLIGKNGHLVDTFPTAPGSCQPVHGATASGVYRFENLAPGTYRLEVDPVELSNALVALLNSLSFVVPPGFVMTTPQAYDLVCGPEGCQAFDPATGLPASPNFGMRYEPTAITLASLDAARAGDGVRVEWETALEIENLGFFVHRASSLDGPRERVNTDLIPGQGTGEGDTYSYLDAAAPDGPLYYWLEDVDWSFVSTFHGPVEVPARDESGARIVRLEWGDPLVLWTRGLPGAIVAPHAAPRLSNGVSDWAPVPTATTTVHGDLYRSEVPLSPEASAGFYRVLHTTTGAGP